MSRKDLDRAIKNARRAQTELDQKSFDADSSRESAASLAEAFAHLTAKVHAGEISLKDAGRERRQLEKNANWDKRVRAQQMGLAKAAFAGGGDAVLAAVIALAWWLGSVRFYAAAWTIVATLVFVYAIQCARAFARAGAKTPDVFHGQSPGWLRRPGLGFYVLALPMLIVAWRHPVATAFANALAVATLGYWFICVCALAPSAIRAGLKRRAALLASDAWHIQDGASSRNAAGRADMARIEAQGNAHRNLFIANVLAVALPLVAMPVASPIATRANYLSVREASPSELPEGSLANTPAAQAMAQTLKSRAQNALAAAIRANAQAAPSWLQEQTLGDTRTSGWSKTGPDGLRAAATAPAFYKGIWRPAGVWVIESHGIYDTDRAALGQGVWFVPFYTDAACKSLATDFAARDKEWLAAQTSGSERYLATSRKPFVDFATANAVPEQGVACVGEPVALLGKPINRDVRYSAIERAEYQRLSLMNDAIDWSDVRARVRNGAPAIQAIGAKIEKVADSFSAFNRNNDMLH